jgi:hypothetical protein
VSTKVKKTWDHTWEKPTEYQLEQVRIAARAAHEAKPEDCPIPDGGRCQSPTLRIWDAMEKEQERWKIN